MRVAVLIGGRDKCANARLKPQLLNFTSCNNHEVHVYMSLNEQCEKLILPNVHVKVLPYECPAIVLNHPRMPETNPWNAFSMYYHNKMSYMMMKESGCSYDCVIKFRPDIVHTSLPTGLLEPMPDNNTIVIPDANHFRGGLNDQIAWGRPEAMEKYMTIYDDLERDLAQGGLKCVLHPETMLRQYLTHRGVSVRYDKNYPYTLDSARHAAATPRPIL